MPSANSDPWRIIYAGAVTWPEVSVKPAVRRYGSVVKAAWWDNDRMLCRVPMRGSTMTKDVVKGESMLPFLRTLDVCFSEKSQPYVIRPGDIVVYLDENNSTRTVHRVIRVDEVGRYAIVKGDNIPRAFSEKVSFDRIIGRVLKVDRGGRTYDLTSSRAVILAVCVAALSRYDLTPGLFKQRFIEPLILLAVRTRFFVKLRRLFYGKISFSVYRKKEKCSLYAFVGGSKSAHAFISPGDSSYVLIDTYIRHRERNPVFAEKFMMKLVEVADSEYGPDVDLRVDDKVLKELVASSDVFFFNERIIFS